MCVCDRWTVTSHYPVILDQYVVPAAQTAAAEPVNFTVRTEGRQELGHVGRSLYVCMCVRFRLGTIVVQQLSE